jgi:N-acetylglucosamine kinase-like BadF-type ATPase
MIAIVYSGSNYADWRLTDKSETISFKTSGINPYFSDEKSILQLLNKNINLIHHAEEIKRIYFFGAGASSEELKNVIKIAFGNFFKYARVSVQHDIEAAAIACCQNKPGIICICGSGSNAAWYDGKKIKPNNYGLGYILADEGSGNWLGKQLVKGFISETLPADIYKKFVKKYPSIDRKSILEKVYRQKNPALFLSSFTDFFADNMADTYVKKTVKVGFDKLIDHYIVPLKEEHPDAHIYFAGSVAASFQPYLYETARDNGINIEYTIKEPINNLLNYYTSKN